jgi:hypothetical protein
LKDSPPIDHSFSTSLCCTSFWVTKCSFLICLYNFLFHCIRSESEAKLGSTNRECLYLGFEEGLRQLVCLSSPSEAFKFTGLRENEVSSTAAGDSLTAEISEEEERLPALIRIGVAVKEDTSVLL